MKDKKITEALVRLNNLGNEMYSKFGTESYTERCELHDIKELLKQVNGIETSQDKALNLAVVSKCEGNGKDYIKNVVWGERRDLLLAYEEWRCENPDTLGYEAEQYVDSYIKLANNNC